MKAIVLAAAKSKKLAPFSNTRPKSMISISGKYILENILNQIVEAQVNEVWLVVNHKKEIIQDYFQYGKSLGVKLDYIEQPDELGIGHAISLAKKVVDDDHFLLVYGDTLMSGNPFIHLLQRFQRTKPKALATITHPVSEGDYGNVYLGHDMKISKFVEKPESSRLSNYIFGGSFILSKEVFNHLEDNQYDLVGYFQKLIANSHMDASLWEDQWIDISRPWHILEANKMMMKHWKSSIIPKSTKIESNVSIKGPVSFGENTHISAGTTLIGPCYIGSNVYIGNNALIRKNSSIGENCKIGYGTEIKNSILFGNSTVGRLSYIGDSVLGKNVQIGSGTVTINYSTSGEEIFFHSSGEAPVKTNLAKVGAFIGDDSIVGTGHTIAPGITVAPGSVIPDRITISNSVLNKPK